MKLAVLFVGLAVMPVMSNADDPPRVLLADLALIFQCTGVPREELEPRFEKLLASQGFRVLNLAKVQRDLGVYLQPTRIHAIDAERRLVEFVSFDAGSGRYHVVLNTEPPTRRFSEFEKRLESFPAEISGCEVKQVNRGSNPESARAIFERKASIVEGWFRQVSGRKAARLETQSPLAMSIDADPQQQEAAPPRVLMVRSTSR